MSSRPASVLLQQLEIRLIHPDPNQPRKAFSDQEMEELASSIRAEGVIHPIIVRPHPEIRGHYMIMDGERRWRASAMAGKLVIPCIAKEGLLSNLDILKLQVMANLHQKRLNPIEEARSFKRFLEDGMSLSQLSELMSLNSQTIKIKMELLNLPDEIQQMIVDGKLSQGRASNLNQFRGPKARLIFLAQALLRGEKPFELETSQLHDTDRGDEIIRGRLAYSDPIKIFRRLMQFLWRSRAGVEVLSLFLSFSNEQSRQLLNRIPRKNKEGWIELLERMSSVCARLAGFLKEVLEEDAKLVTERNSAVETKPKGKNGEASIVVADSKVVELPKPAPKPTAPTTRTLSSKPAAKAQPAAPVVSQAEWATRHAQTATPRRKGPEPLPPPKPIAKAGEALEVLTAMFYYNSPARLQVCLSQQVLRQRLRINGADGQLVVRVKEAFKVARENWKRPLNTKDPQEKALVQLISSLRFDSGDTTFEQFVESIPRNDHSLDPIDIKSFT
ncbi:ParB/RepB/Spo0J family partition protein [Candidatus Parcubacteria bacterium]|nr:MAG: ParB/RepB/Spo0J family partition protein [Candidatus Parcubacteria bacterium]